MNSDYIYFIKGKVLIIEDSDLGILPETIIYKDSERNFDGVEHEEGKFKRFYSVNESDLEKALEKVRLWTQWKTMTLHL